MFDSLFDFARFALPRSETDLGHFDAIIEGDSSTEGHVSLLWDVGWSSWGFEANEFEESVQNDDTGDATKIYGIKTSSRS